MSSPKKKWNTWLTTNEIVDIINDLASDDEATAADIYIDPPGDGLVSDSDSGDERNVSFENLSRGQLLAPAELTLHGKNVSDGSESEEEALGPITSRTVTDSQSLSNRRRSRSLIDNPLFPPPPPPRSPKVVRKWVKRDLSQLHDEWIAPLPRSVITLSEASEPVDLFELFFSHEVIMHIVRHSVIYAVQKGNPGFTLSDNDIYCFIGILILTGYSPLPRRRMYWESNEDTHNILVAKSMRRNRFEEILRHFHVVDNINLCPNDKMAKVRPLFDLLNKKFLQYAVIEKNISIDESMIPYYGRHGCKQHIRGKPIRFGFKTWIAALPLGYCLYADPYQGRYETFSTGLGQYVVQKLMTEIQNVYKETRFSVFCDNFFTGLPLITAMKEKNILVTGTVRSNRTDKCPLKDEKLCKKEQRGYHDSRLDLNSGICAVRWNDNSVVTLLSSEYGVEPIQTARRYSAAQKQRVNVPQPNVVHQYNRFMGGVDRLDANIGTYRIAIRGKKWYIPLLFWLIDVAVNNATLLARNFSKDIDTLEFRRSIARTLLQKYGNDKQHPGPSKRVSTNVPTSVRKHNAEHMIGRAPSRLRCAYCKSLTVTFCQKCKVNLHSKCFSVFHS
ncbi:unnamed protein product [Parnassius mnemosyne]